MIVELAAFRDTNSFGIYDPADPSGIPSDTVYVVTEDSSKNLWLGTWNGGLSRFDREIASAEEAGDTKRLEELKADCAVRDGVVELLEVAGGYEFSTRSDMALLAAYQHEIKTLKRDISSAEEEGLGLVEQAESAEVLPDEFVRHRVGRGLEEHAGARRHQRRCGERCHQRHGEPAGTGRGRGQRVPDSRPGAAADRGRQSSS